MVLVPRDPVVGGTVLRRAAIASPDFATGSSGWSINQDGSAEFNDLVIRNGQIISGVFLLYSSAIPAKGKLICSIAAAAGTDNIGNNYGQGLNLGKWSASTGNMLQHFGVDDNGLVYIVGPDNVTRILINNGTGGTGPDIRFYNDFGAVILVVDPNSGGVFQYEDTGSATQGPLVGAFVSKNSVDPIDGTTADAGINVIDPVFGDSIQVVGANVSWNQVGFTLKGLQTANLGSGATSPFMHTAAPEQGHAGHVVQRWYGTSADGTVPAGSVLSLTDPPVRATPSVWEVQGDQVLTEMAAPAAAAHPRHFASSVTGMLRFVSDTTKGDSNTYDTGRKVLTAAGQLVNSLTAVAVTGITGISVAAIKYLIRGCVIVIQGGTTAIQAVQFAGPAIANMNVSFNCIEGGTVLSSGVTGAIGSNMSSGAVPAGTTGELHFDGIITFSAAGSTFGLDALCVTSAADTWTLSGNSYLEMCPVG